MDQEEDQVVIIDVFQPMGILALVPVLFMVARVQGWMAHVQSMEEVYADVLEVANA